MAEKEATERRVYNLPADLMERLKAFQTAQNISSEAEAVRRLLDAALQMRDTIDSLLLTLQRAFLDEKDLRALAAMVLARHALVTKIEISDDEVTFDLRNGDRGKIEKGGNLHRIRHEDSTDYWTSVDLKTKPGFPAKKTTSTGWDAAGDLDDDIPF